MFAGVATLQVSERSETPDVIISAAFGEHCVKYLVISVGWQVVTMKTLSAD